jgi:hypothetical protein
MEKEEIRMTLNRAARVVTVFALLAVGSAGCERKMVMRYDLTGTRMVPLLRPGDVIEWQGIPGEKILWKFNKTPCEESTGNTCTIKGGTEGKIFSYKCAPDMPCDPEIAVDDGVLVTVEPTLEGARALSMVVAVYFACTGNQVSLDPERPVRAGDVITWRALDLVNPTWNATFALPDQACGSPNPITGPDGTCAPTQSGSFDYQFSVTHADCGGTATASVALQVNP